MSLFLSASLGCFINAIILCGLTNLFVRKYMRHPWNIVFTWFAYLFFALTMTGLSEGIMHMRLEDINWLQWKLYALAGTFVCIILFILSRERTRNMEKYGIEEMKKARRSRLGKWFDKKVDESKRVDKPMTALKKQVGKMYSNQDSIKKDARQAGSKPQTQQRLYEQLQGAASTGELVEVRKQKVRKDDSAEA